VAIERYLSYSSPRIKLAVTTKQHTGGKAHAEGHCLRKD